MLGQTSIKSYIIIFFVICMKSVCSELIDKNNIDNLCLICRGLITTESPIIVPENITTVVFDKHLKSKIKVEYGQHVRFICDFNSSPSMEIKWEARGTILSTDRVLDIKSVTEEFHGAYLTCNLVSGQSVLNTRGANILISDLAPPTISKLTPSNVSTTDNSKLTLACTIVKGTPPPTINWQVKRHGANEFEDLTATGEELTFRVSLKDNGLYRCTAKNKKGEDHKLIDVTVRKSPVVKIEGPSNMTFNYGSRRQFTCSISGYPLPKTMWMDGKGNKLTSKDLKMNWHEKYSKLNLKKVTKSDNYTCYAQNIYGETEFDTIKVIVLSPFVVHEYPKADSKVHYSASTNITCNITSSFPMRIKWFQPNAANSSEQIEIHNDKRFEITKEVLKIKSMDLNMVGKYTCVASLVSDTNEKISYTTNLQINDLASPSISDTTKLAVMEKTDLTLSCHIDGGIPRPTFSWQVKTHGKKTYKDLNIITEELDIKDITIDAAGKYRCVSKNDRGELNKVTEVVVKKAPTTFIADESAVSVAYGSNLTYTCRVVGYPLPTVAWKDADGTLLKAEETTINEHEVTSKITVDVIRSANQFYCHANNSLGSSESSMNVTVLSSFTIHEIPKAAKAPVVTITEGSRVDVDFAGHIELTCKVSGYPKPKIWWTSADGTTVSEESHVVELPYDYISYLKLTNIKHTGTYQCRAENKKASKFAEVLVYRRSPFRIQTPPPKTISVKYEEPATIRCDTKSSMPMKMKWYYQKDERSPRSEILPSEKYKLSVVSVRLDNVGKYTCEAYLVDDETERKSFTTNVEINNLKAPEITYSNKTITVTKGGMMSAFCITNGIPKPVVTWQFKPMASDVFIALPDKGERISEPNIGYEKAGLYTCTASNDLGAENRTIDVVVNGVPRITNIDTVYYGVTGDKVLKIPCEVDGFPEPKITWRNEDKVVSSGAKLSVIRNAIYIKNPTEKDSNNYTCEAKNPYGNDTKTFKAEISDFISYDEALNSNIYLKLGESTDMKCLLPHSDPNSIRWYMNGEKSGVIGTFYSIKNAQYSNDGNYTCRLNTDEGSESLNYVVDVGYKPSFKADAPATIDWQGNKDDTLDCDVNAKPSAKVRWFYNGKSLNVVWPELAIFGWGQYSCIASNEHDSVQRSFNVTSYGCLINSAAVNENHIPLLIDEKLKTWPALATINEFYTIGQNETITLECATLRQPDNTFQTLPSAKRINAKCKSEDNFTVDKKTYKFNELQCKADVKPSHVLTKKSCMKNGTVVEVGFKLIDTILIVYEACYNRVDSSTLYTKVVMSTVNNGNTVSLSVKGGKHGAELRKCQYNLRRLVNPEDVTFGPAQTATMSELYNTVIVYEPCEGSNSSRWSWSGVENTVQSALYSSDVVTVWTGASQLDSSRIPRYLWKVVLDNHSFETIVYVNAENPNSSDILCPETNSDRFTDITDAGDQYTYICSINDFLKAFKATLTDFQ